MITVLRRYVGHIIDPPQRLKSSLKTIGGMGCCTKERFCNSSGPQTEWSAAKMGISGKKSITLADD